MFGSMIRVVFVVWVLKLRRLVIGGWLIHGLQPKGGSAAGYIGRSGRRLPELVEPSSKSKKCGESLKAFLSLAIRGLQSDCARSCAAWGGYHPGHPSTVTKEWHDLRCSTRRYARVPRSLATAHRPSFPLRPIRKSTSWAPPASSDTQISFLCATRVGDVCGCGAVITTGFPSIIVDHRPLAHLDSPTSHGGRIVSGSPDTFGSFTFGEAVPRTVVDFAKLGAVRPDGSVDDRLMAELLADPHLEQRALLSGALVQPSSTPATTAR